MQPAHGLSLNALRVFLIAARHLSIRRAAQDLGVTPGAVSHQIKGLEDRLGIRLLTRGNNSIALTEAGTLLLERAGPGLDSLDAALASLARDPSEIRVTASMTFAFRWLIPRLEDFKRRNPAARVILETATGSGSGGTAGPDADIVIGYCRRDASPEGAEVLFDDICRPYLSPALLARLPDPGDLARVPALQCAAGNWDWKMWLADQGMSGHRLAFAGHFDLDDAALRAAIAGMGMVLTSRFMIEDEIAAGRLCPLPGSAASRLGCYTLHRGAPANRLPRRFASWIADIAAADTAP
ncbi:MAG: LysR substrate-binding domain-containing protein [Paracoccaceae bacterium]